MRSALKIPASGQRVETEHEDHRSQTEMETGNGENASASSLPKPLFGYHGVSVKIWLMYHKTVAFSTG